jgi:tetratricopeptide (TPR) repeat protein
LTTAFLSFLLTISMALSGPAASAAAAAENAPGTAAAGGAVVAPASTSLDGDASKLFQQGRVLESQGNVEAAGRVYEKITQLRPGFVYGWSQLGNSQVVFGDLDRADDSYSTAIGLCRQLEDRQEAGGQDAVSSSPWFLGGVGASSSPCGDLYVILLNRGSLRLNHGQPELALRDLEAANRLRARPDAVVLQNLARAKELTGDYAGADEDYDLAIQMTSNEVNPFWLRSALVKYQLGRPKPGLDLLKRVRNRFPDAPEVKAAYAVFLYGGGASKASGNVDDDGSNKVQARQVFLEIPDRARLKFSDPSYLRDAIGWPPSMVETLRKLTVAVGDDARAARQ